MKKTLILMLLLIIVLSTSGCDLFTTTNENTTLAPTMAVPSTTIKNESETKTNAPTTTKKTTLEYHDEFQIVYIVDGNEYAKEMYYTEEEIKLKDYNGGGLFFGWYKDYSFNDGPYDSYISYEMDPVYLYAYTLNGNHEEAIRLISLIDEYDMFNSKEVIDAKEYIKTLSSDELEKVTNIDILNKAIYIIDSETAIYNLAYTYHFQGVEIQYDQNNSRRNVYALPESASEYRNLYLDCSSYVNNIYHAIFNEDIVPGDVSRVDTAAIDKYAREEYLKDDSILYYIETKDYTTEEAKKELLTEIRNTLLPGDIICYRHGKTSGSAGHVMVYIGNKKFLHCTGTSTNITLGTYNPANFTDAATTTEANFGAVNVLSASDVFDLKTSNRYLFNNAANSSSYVWSFEVIRPLNRNLTMTDEGKNRLDNGIVLIEKSSDILPFTSLTLGSKIDYTLTIENKNKYDLKNVEVKEIIPEGMNLISIDREYKTNGNECTFNVNIKSGETITISYSLEVSKDKTFIGATLEDETYVSGIETNKIYYLVRDDMDYETLESELRNKISVDANSIIPVLKETYSAITGKNILEAYLNEIEILDDLFQENELNHDSDAYQLLSNDMYGGVKIATTSPKDNNRIRLVKNEYLECGDIVLTMTTYSNQSGKYEGFIYLDESTILGIKDGKLSILYDTKDKVDKFLVTLVAYNEFAIIKPTLN